MKSTSLSSISLSLTIFLYLTPSTHLLAENVFPQDGKIDFGNCKDGYGRIVWEKETEKGWKAGSYYEGYFKNSLPDGYGKLFWSATGCIYFGEFKEGHEHGIGTIRWPDGQGYTGEFRNGKPAGTGFSMAANGDWRLHKSGTEFGLSISKDGKLEREDIFGLSPTKDANSPGGILIPSNLEECLKELNSILSPEFIEKIRSGSKDDINEYHFGLGMWMRNNWDLWGYSHLATWFQENGINHPDDMSGIILVSFWRRLNDKPIAFDEQIKHYQKYWKEEREAESTKESNGKKTNTQP